MKETKTGVTLNEIFFAYFIDSEVTKQCNLISNNMKIINISVIKGNQIKIEFKLYKDNTIHFALIRHISNKTLAELYNTKEIFKSDSWIYKEIDVNNNDVIPSNLEDKILLELRDVAHILIFTYYMLNADKYDKLKDVMGGFWCISRIRAYAFVLEWKRRYNNFSEEELKSMK